MTVYTESNNYKASIYVKGACPQHRYGKNLANLRAQALRLLTDYKPGLGGLWPDHVDIQQHERTISGNRAAWKVIETIKFADIPEEFHQWKIRERLRAAQQPPPPPKEEPPHIFTAVCHLMLRRQLDPTWQAMFAVLPEHNRCFNQEYLRNVVASRSVDLAWDLLHHDFARLTPPWQLNLTGRCWNEWLTYEREQRLGKEVMTNG